MDQLLGARGRVSRFLVILPDSFDEDQAERTVVRPLGSGEGRPARLGNGTCLGAALEVLSARGGSSIDSENDRFVGPLLRAQPVLKSRYCGGDLKKCGGFFAKPIGQFRLDRQENCGDADKPSK